MRCEKFRKFLYFSKSIPTQYFKFKVLSIGPLNSEKKVVIINKGIFSICMRLSYNQPTGEYELQKVFQEGTIAAAQNYAFCKFQILRPHSLEKIILGIVLKLVIPSKVDLNAPTPVWLTIDVIGGVHVTRQAIQFEEECYHVWGTSLDPRFSRINLEECYK